MPTQLVDDVRRVLTDADRPLTGRERVLLMAAIAGHPDRDVVDELVSTTTALRAWTLPQTATRGPLAPEHPLARTLTLLDALAAPYTPPPTTTPPPDLDPDVRRRADAHG